ncbi:MAG: hypothetical protein ABIN01_21735 [Ferruginibacter sp.]
MKQRQILRSYACDIVPLWETLHHLEITASATINPAFLQNGSCLAPENIIIIISRAPPNNISSVRSQSG